MYTIVHIVAIIEVKSRIFKKIDSGMKPYYKDNILNEVVEIISKD